MASKTCASCGREMQWRAKWAANWNEVRYCSEACRSQRVSPLDRQLEDAIRALLDARAADVSICPSEAAKAVDADSWRDHMESARRAARRLVAAGEVVITQGGVVVDPSRAKGAIRIRRRRAGDPGP